MSVKVVRAPKLTHTVIEVANVIVTSDYGQNLLRDASILHKKRIEEAARAVEVEHSQTSYENEFGAFE